MLKRTRRVRALGVILILALILSVQLTALAQEGGLTTAPESAALARSSVHLGAEDKSIPSRENRLRMSGVEKISVIVTLDDSVNANQLTALGQVVHEYSLIFRGASLIIEENRLDTLAGISGVTGIYLDQLLQPDTEVSPAFIGAPVAWAALGGQEHAGEGTIVGILDSGIWPEHASFSDPDPLGNTFPPPPVLPGSNGFGAGGPRDTCDFGDTAWNPDDAPFTCNNKLIGAYDFLDTYRAVRGLLPTEFDSARDDNGHGTHTASTAAGNGGVAASLFGVDRGSVSGIAPRAHVIAYRVCGDAGCFSSDSAAAVEQAMLDDVDSINFSISGGGDPYSDIVELAFAAAYESGVFISASAGNSGPTPDTVAHRGPWTMTVGASTTDRHFISTVSLQADIGDTLQLEGATVTDGISTPTPVVMAEDFGDGLCLSPFAPGTFSGEIVVCERGTIARVAKSFNVAAGGAGGMLLYNPVLQGLATDNHFIPSVHLENDAGRDLVDFIGAHTSVSGTFTAGLPTLVQGDKMAVFSSRGGPNQSLGISKPDITAPGVQILAGHTPLPATVAGGLPGELFQSIQGTSMSSPHIAGSAALVKALHPDWTPGQIKSALMTTAHVAGVTKEDGSTPADWFDFGSGRVDLSQAGFAAITFDESTANYLALKDHLWDANYPSLYVPTMPGEINVQRTVRNETNARAFWDVTVSSPPDVTVTAPAKLKLQPNGSRTFDITVNAENVPFGETRFALIEMSNGSQTHHFPITIVRNPAAVTIDKTCSPGDFAVGGTTVCSISMTNTSFDDAMVSMFDQSPKNLRILDGSVVGGDELPGNAVRFNGPLLRAAPPIVNVTVDASASPFGYVPLSSFGVGDIGATDESITNFDVPSFAFAGEVYSQIGIVSNGYIVVGGGTGADVDFINTDFPDPALPNNVLAPFWTDLNPSAGGQVLAAVLTAGDDTWIVVEWESVPNFGDGETNTAQVWIGLNTDANPGEDIFFVYGDDVSDGDGGFLTVGAENPFGNSGGTVYFDGTGTPPTPTNSTDYAVDVFSTPGETGETHVVSFTAGSAWVGPYTNCAEMTTDLTFGTSVSCYSGEVTDDE